MRKLVVCTLLVSTLAACEPPEQLTDYRPVVDPGRTNAAKFESDLVACRNIAVTVEADYKKKQTDQMVAGLIAGALVGAATGAVVGNNTGYKNDYILAGTAAGAAGGAASTDYSYDLVKFGPRRIVDRCMADRGHSILNDPGRG